jgi:hypothetical protein
MNIATLSKLMKTSTLPGHPFFFNISIVQDEAPVVHMFATASEADRTAWMQAVNELGVSAMTRGLGSGP